MFGEEGCLHGKPSLHNIFVVSDVVELYVIKRDTMFSLFTGSVIGHLKRNSKIRGKDRKKIEIC